MKDKFDVTEKFLKGLPKKYWARVDSVDRDSDGYLVYLAEGWFQEDDEITTVVDSTMAQARKKVMRAGRK